MGFDPLTSAFELGKSLLDKFVPDPIKKMEQLQKLEELKQKGDAAALNAEVQLMLGQIEINKIEAQSKNFWQSGWRPFIGWTCGAAIAYQFFVYQFLIWIWGIFQAFDKIPSGVNPPPVIETGALFSLVTGMLGVGGMRSYDKQKGTHSG